MVIRSIRFFCNFSAAGDRFTDRWNRYPQAFCLWYSSMFYISNMNQWQTSWSFRGMGEKPFSSSRS